MTFSTFHPSVMLAVAVGGAAGATLRYAVSTLLTEWHGAAAAWSTLVINVVGAFALGAFAAMLAGRTGPVPAFWMVGLCGAFTTFSTFALDALTLWRVQGPGLAALYVGLSVVLAIAAFAAAMAIFRGAAA